MLAVIQDLLLMTAVGYLLGAMLGSRQAGLAPRHMIFQGLLLGLATLVSGLVVIACWLAGAQIIPIIMPDYLDRLTAASHFYPASAVWLLSLCGGGIFYRASRSGQISLEKMERLSFWSLKTTTMLIAGVLGAIFLTLLVNATHFFHYVSPSDFFFGLHWNMQGVATSPPEELGRHFGIIPLLLGTLVISSLAVLTALPLSIPAATYLAEYASQNTRRYFNVVIRILAGIPTIVYGFFAIAFFSPALVAVANFFDLQLAAESALVAGFVTGIMIIPITTSVIYETMSSIPQSLREGAYSLGATKAETILRVVLPASKSGILVGVLLALSRAVGETMIVVMAAGVQAELTVNPLRAMTTGTVQIVRALAGDAQFDSPKTLVAFALGVTLLVITVSFNSAALLIMRKRRKGGHND